MSKSAGLRWCIAADKIGTICHICSLSISNERIVFTPNKHGLLYYFSHVKEVPGITISSSEKWLFSESKSHGRNCSTFMRRAENLSENCSFCYTWEKWTRPLQLVSSTNMHVSRENDVLENMASLWKIMERERGRYRVILEQIGHGRSRIEKKHKGKVASKNWKLYASIFR